MSMTGRIGSKAGQMREDLRQLKLLSIPPMFLTTCSLCLFLYTKRKNRLKKAHTMAQLIKRFKGTLLDVYYTVGDKRICSMNHFDILQQLITSASC